jgi:hypothetical protein
MGQGAGIRGTSPIIHPIRFADERTRARFVRHVAQDSGGVPAAIRGMLERAEAEEEITPAWRGGSPMRPESGTST